MSPSSPPRFFTETEVAGHCTKDSCWVLLGTRVYDVTAFLRMHPGGEALVLRRSGRDVSREMEGPPHRHSDNARRWMEQYYIGELRRDSGAEEAQVDPDPTDTPLSPQPGRPQSGSTEETPVVGPHSRTFLKVYVFAEC